MFWFYHMPPTGQETVNFIDEGWQEKMKCMVMFQYLTCDMHFGIIKIYGFLSKTTDRMFFFNSLVRQVH